MGTLQIEATRFGSIAVPEDTIIHMPKPVLGFERITRYVLLQPNEISPFVWLQAVNQPDLAFLLVNPTLFFADYRIEINRREVEDIELDDSADADVLAIVTVTANPDDMTVNLQGPIVINTRARKAKQLVLSSAEWSVTERLFKTKPEDEGVSKERHVAMAQSV